MALGPTPYAPAGLDQILAQLDNAAILERARQVGLGDLLGGGGAAFPAQVGSIPYGAGAGTGAGVMPYGYGSLETPTTDALLEAIRRRGVYAGGRGFLKGTGQPLGLPRATLARELQGGMYGAGGSTIGQNVIPMGNPSPIPPGAGRGATAADMPYAQWQQASDDLVASVQRQGPYMGTRGWARNSGPSYMAESGYPRQLALPQYADQIPSQNIGAAGAANPSSIPAGAGIGTGAEAMPYAEQAIALGPVREAPVRQSTLRNTLRNGAEPASRMSFSSPVEVAVDTSPQGLLRSSGIDPRTLEGQNAGVNGTWGAATELPASHPAVSGVLADTVTDGGRSARSGFFTRNARFLGSEASGGGFGAPGGFVRNYGRGLMGRPALSAIEGRKPSLMGRAGGALGRGTVVVAAPIFAGAAADKFGDDSIAGQFAEGYSYGGSVGGLLGLPGSVVGGLGAGLGNVGANAISGRGIKSLWGGEEADPTPFSEAMRAEENGTDREGNVIYTPRGQLMAMMTNAGEFGRAADALGMDQDTYRSIVDPFEERLANTNDQEKRVQILGEAADALLERVNGESQGAMRPADLAAMQVAASQIMAPVAADSMALGQMQAAALNSLSGSLPEAYRPVVANMANQITPRSQQVANAYIQQATAMPQLNVLDSYQNQVDQTAQQLTAQALADATGSGGGSDFASIIANAGTSANGGGSADIVNQFANL